MPEEPNTNKNITETVELPKTAESTCGDKEKPDSTQSEHQEDHPYMALVDIAIEESVIYCRDNQIPEPKIDLWDNFARNCMNRALWHYCPDSLEPDIPILNLLIGVGGLGLCFAPPIIYLIKGKLEEHAETDSTQSEQESQNSTQETDESLIYELPNDSILPAVAPKRVAIGGEE